MDTIQTPTPNQVKKLVLVAEDDLFYANIYNAKLTAEGFEVVIAHNGDETIKFILGRKPDILLLDLIMPEKDGFQTLELIRSNPATKDIKVIVLSNLGQDEDIKRAKAYGVLDYIVKSDISIQNLVKVIKDALA